MRTTTSVVLALVAGTSLLAGCGGGTTAAAPATTTAATPASTVAGAAATSAAAATSTAAATSPASGAVGSGTGCAPVGAGVPAGAISVPTVDVDGDSRPDTAWRQGDSSSSSLTFGITTASGATFSTPYGSADGSDTRRMFVADVDGAGTIAAIIYDGRSAGLYTVHNCSLVHVVDAGGAPYGFDLKNFRGNGTGIGCSQVAGTSGTGLVGLELNRDAAGTPVSVTRTAVVLDGTTARNGPSDTVDVSADPNGPAATTATAITCGDRTAAADAVG